MWAFYTAYCLLRFPFWKQPLPFYIEMIHFRIVEIRQKTMDLLPAEPEAKIN